MFKSHAHRTMDMTEGSLLTKVLFFSLPIMLSGILQLLFNAADTIVVGRFAGNEALAARCWRSSALRPRARCLKSWVRRRT